MVVALNQWQAISYAWSDASSGEEVGPRGLKTLEVRNWRITIQVPYLAPLELPGRKLATAIGAYEACQLVGQHTEPDYADRWPFMASFRNDGVFDGAYGSRVYGQLGRIVAELTRDPESRRAVLTIHDSREFLGRVDTLDTPCTLSIQFLIRHRKLMMTVTMRSNDAWLGLPYDLVQFAALQSALASALKVGIGPYTHQVGSLHLYERHVPLAHEYSRGNHQMEWANLKFIPILWSGTDIEGISRTARHIMAGRSSELYTPWEKFCLIELGGSPDGNH